MPLPYHVIDGYNLLHAAGLARASYGPGDLERARTALLLKVAEGLDDAERERATVVFDARDPPPDAERRFRFRELTVLFAAEGGDADALIEELIRRHPSPRQLRVVSDDLRLQKAAKRRGCQAVKCDAFLGRLKRRSAPARSPEPMNPGGSDAGVGDWLEFFGVGGDVAAEIAEEMTSPKQAAEPQPGSAAPAGSSAPIPTRPAERPAGGRTTPQRGRSDGAGEESAEDLGFWQRRIDDLLAEERRRRPGAG